MYGGGGCSTLIADWCASSRERPGAGDEGADELGGVGKGERERFWGREVCEDDACGCRVPSCEPEGTAGSAAESATGSMSGEGAGGGSEVGA